MIRDTRDKFACASFRSMRGKGEEKTGFLTHSWVYLAVSAGEHLAERDRDFSETRIETYWKYETTLGWSEHNVLHD